jgi:prepilin-type N-terminal cleavage/methylation domain-containing protein
VRPTDLTDGVSAHLSNWRRDTAGVTLIELMVAMLLLGVILSAAASSLIQFGRTAADNERRVQATALMTRLHEEMQALPWRNAVVYENDLEALNTAGFDGLTDTPVWALDGQEIATLEGPDASPRRQGVPLLVTPIEIDERDYDVIRFVTWSDQPASIKRFTTVVTWRLYDRVYEERFVSERAATAAESGDPELPRVVQFDVGPSRVQLIDVASDEPAQNEQEIQITVRFSEGVDSASVSYESVDVTLDAGGSVDTLVLTEKSLALTPYITDPVTGRYIAFRGTIAAATRTFPNGTRSFKARGVLGADVFFGRTSIEFEGGSIEPEDVGEAPTEPPPPPDPTDPPPSEPIAVNAVTISSPTTVCNDADDRFMKPVTITASVNGMTPADYDVSVAYSANGSPRSEAMTPVAPDTFALTNATFTTTFSAGVDHGFRPVGQNKNQAKDETDFIVTATRLTAGTPATLSTNPQKLTVILDHGSNPC